MLASDVGSSLSEIKVKIAVPVLPSASKVALDARVRTPLRFWLLTTRTEGGPAVFVTEILLKSVTADPLMFWIVDPLNTTVPVPRLNVPLLTKLPARLSVAGAFSVPEIVICLKLVVDVPEIELVPLKTTVPLLCVKVPLLTKLPATFIEPLGAVKVPLITMLLNELTLDPEMAVVPPKMVVAPAFSVPLLTRFPLILRLEEGVRVPVMVMFPKIGVELPETIVVPEKVMALEVSVELALLTKFPFMSIALLPALKEPLVRVSVPLTVTSLASVNVADPVLVRFASAVVLAGSSTPELIAPDILYTTL